MLIEPRSVKLTTRTGVEIRRTLPHAKLKMIGAWCFVDHFGPTTVTNAETNGMLVAAHPHTGLQTVTWLFEGRIEHRDSIGSVQLIEPGQLNLMTAGRGISHSEVSVVSEQAKVLHAVQLWLALPQESIGVSPKFEHLASLPRFDIAHVSDREIASATVLAGEFMGYRATTNIFSPIVGAEIRLRAGETVELPLNPNFEHGFLLAQGGVKVEGTDLPLSGLQYFAPGVESATLTAGNTDAILLLLGGEPFGEKILMWWNFIGRSQEEISKARTDWNSQDRTRFPSFVDDIGGWIPAPDLPNVTLQPR